MQREAFNSEIYRLLVPFPVLYVSLGPRQVDYEVYLAPHLAAETPTASCLRSFAHQLTFDELGPGQHRLIINL